MSKRLSLQVDRSLLAFPVTRVLVAGYTGRDQDQVRQHIAELERQGIAAPDGVPAVYPLDAAWVTTETALEVSAPHVSGEAEPALLFPGNNLESALVSVIVDFTDREEERRSIARSKVLPKPMSEIVWRYKDVAGAWDEIALRSWVAPGPDPPLYQSGKLRQLLAPRDLLARLSGLEGGLQGTVLLMGTLPLCSGEFSFSDYFRCEMEAPGGAKLSCECSLRRPQSAHRCQEARSKR